MLTVEGYWPVWNRRSPRLWFVSEFAEEGLVFDPMIDAALHFDRVGFSEVTDVPVDLSFDHIVDFSAADVNRVLLDDIENRRRLPERARRFTKDSLHPPVFDPAGYVADCITKNL